MSDDMGTERAPQEEIEQPTGGQEPERPEIEHPDPLGGDDESGYGGAGQSETGQERQDRGESDPNRPPSEQDEDQGI